jgi:hypothetical protein
MPLDDNVSTFQLHAINISMAALQISEMETSSAPF